MKKVFILSTFIIINMSFISCNQNSIAETDAIYQNLSATEGDDGELIKDPDAE